MKARARLCRIGKASIEKGALRLQTAHTGEEPLAFEIWALQ